MLLELVLLYAYRLMALAVALMMIGVIFRKPNWQEQFFALLVLVPFALRAAGVK